MGHAFLSLHLHQATPWEAKGDKQEGGKEERKERQALPPMPRHSLEGEVRTVILGGGSLNIFKKVVAFPHTEA